MARGEFPSYKTIYSAKTNASIMEAATKPAEARRLRRKSLGDTSVRREQVHVPWHHLSALRRNQDEITLSSVLRRIPGLMEPDKICVVGQLVAKVDALHPKFTQVTNVFLSNNCITDLAGLAQFRQVKALSLASNKIDDICQLDVLANNCPDLKVLVLDGNPITSLPNYRAHAIHRLPSLKSLDHKAITAAERVLGESAVKQEENLMDVMMNNVIQIFKLERALTLLRVHMELRGVVYSRMASFNRDDIPLYTPFELHRFLSFCDLEQRLGREERLALLSMLHRKVRHAYVRVSRSTLIPEQLLRNESFRELVSNNKAETQRAVQKSWELAFTDVMTQLQSRVAKLLGLVAKAKEQIDTAYKRLFAYDPFGRFQKSKEEQESRLNNSKQEREELIEEFQSTMQSFLESFQLTGVTGANDSTMMRTLPAADGPGDAGGDLPLSSTWGTPWTLPHPGTADGKKGASLVAGSKRRKFKGAGATAKALNASMLTRWAGNPMTSGPSNPADATWRGGINEQEPIQAASVPRGEATAANIRDFIPNAYKKLSRSMGALDSDEDDRTPRRTLPQSEMSTPVRLDQRPTQASLDIPVKLPTTPKGLGQPSNPQGIQRAADDTQVRDVSMAASAQAASLAATLPATLRDLRAMTSSYSQRHTREKQLRHLAEVGAVHLPATDVKTASRKSSADDDGSGQDPSKVSPRKHLSRDIMAKSPLAPKSPTVAKTPFGICVTPAPALALFQLKLKQGHRRKALGGSAAGNRSSSTHDRSYKGGKMGRSGGRPVASGLLGPAQMTVLEDVAELDGVPAGFGELGTAPMFRGPSAYQSAAGPSTAVARESQMDSGVGAMERRGWMHEVNVGTTGTDSLAWPQGGFTSHREANSDPAAERLSYQAAPSVVNDWGPIDAAGNQGLMAAREGGYRKTEESRPTDSSAWQASSAEGTGRVAAASSTSPARSMEPGIPRDVGYRSPGKGLARPDLASRLGEAAGPGGLREAAGGTTVGQSNHGGGGSNSEGRDTREQSPYRNESAGRRGSGDSLAERLGMADAPRQMPVDNLGTYDVPKSFQRPTASLASQQGLKPVDPTIARMPPPTLAESDSHIANQQRNHPQSQNLALAQNQSQGQGMSRGDGQQPADGGLRMGGPDKATRDTLLHEAQVAALQLQLSQLRSDLLAHAQGESRLQALNIALRDRLQQMQSESTRDAAATESQLASLTLELDRCRALQVEWEAKAAALRAGQAAAEQALEDRAALWMTREAEAEQRRKALEKAKEGLEKAKEGLERAREEERVRAERELAAARAQVEEERRAREQQEARLRLLEEEHMRAWESNAALQAQLNAVEEKDHVTARSHTLACRAILRRNLYAWARATSSRHQLAHHEKLAKAQSRRRVLRLGLSTLLLATSRARGMAQLAHARGKRACHLALLAWTALARVRQYLRAISCRRANRLVAAAFQRWRGYLRSRGNKRRVYAIARRHASIHALGRSITAWECHVALCRLTPAEEKKGTVMAAVQYRSLCLRRAWFAWCLWMDSEARPRAQRMRAMRARAGEKVGRAVLKRWGRDYMQYCERARKRKARADGHYKSVLRGNAMQAWKTLRSTRQEGRAQASLADRRYLSWCFHVWRCALLAILEERFLGRKADRLRQALLARRALRAMQASVALGQQQRVAMGKAARYYQRVCTRRAGAVFRVWVQQQEHRRRLRTLSSFLCHRRQRQVMAAAFQRWHGLLLATRMFALKELQDELQAAQASSEERDGRIVSLEIEGVRAVDRLQQAAVQLARVTTERDQAHAAAAELQQEAERARAVEKGLRAQLEQAAARHDAYEKEIADIKAEMSRSQDASLDQEAHHVLRAQALERQVAALKEELAAKELVLSSCEKALETTAARLESTTEESAAKAAAAYDLVASLRSLLEEKDKALEVAKAGEERLRCELDDVRQQAQATNDTVQQAAALRDLRVRELEAALAATEGKLEHTKVELEDAEKRVSDRDAEVDRLAYQVKLLNERERRRVEDILERMRLAGVTTVMPTAATMPTPTSYPTATMTTASALPAVTSMPAGQQATGWPAASPSSTATRLAGVLPGTTPQLDQLDGDTGDGRGDRLPRTSRSPDRGIARSSPSPMPSRPAASVTAGTRVSPTRAAPPGSYARQTDGDDRTPQAARSPGMASPGTQARDRQLHASGYRVGVASTNRGGLVEEEDEKDDGEEETPRFALPDREVGPWAPIGVARVRQAGGRDFEEESEEGDDGVERGHGPGGASARHTNAGFPGFPASTGVGARVKDRNDKDYGTLGWPLANKAPRQRVEDVGINIGSLTTQVRQDQPATAVAGETKRAPAGSPADTGTPKNIKSAISGLGDLFGGSPARQSTGQEGGSSHGKKAGRRAQLGGRDSEAYGVKDEVHVASSKDALVAAGTGHRGGGAGSQLVWQERVPAGGAGQDGAIQRSSPARMDLSHGWREPRSGPQEPSHSGMQRADYATQATGQSRGQFPRDGSYAGFASGGRGHDDRNTPSERKGKLSRTGHDGGEDAQVQRQGARSGKEDGVAELRQQIQVLQERILGRLRDSPGFPGSGS